MDLSMLTASRRIVRRCAGLVFVSLTLGGVSLGQGTAPTEEEVKAIERQKAAAEARKAIEEAERDAAQAIRDKERAQSPQAAALKELETQKAAAEARKARREADKAALEASLPAVSAQALEGKTSFKGDFSIEAAFLTSQAVSEGAASIATAIGSQKPAIKRVLIHNEKDYATAMLLGSVLIDLHTLNARYDDLLKQPQPSKGEAIGGALPLVMAIPVAVTLAKSVIDALALFRTEVEVEGRQIAVDEVAIVSEIAATLASTYQIQTVYPTLFLPGLLAGKDSELAVAFAKLRKNRFRRPQASTDAGKGDSKPSEMPGGGDAKEKPEKKPEKKPEENASSNSEKASPLEVLDGQADQLIATLSDSDDKAGPILSVLLRTELVMKTVQEPDTAVLFVKSLSAGGSTRVSRNLWRGSKEKHSGGAVMAYFLFRGDGVILGSGVVRKIVTLNNDLSAAAVNASR